MAGPPPQSPHAHPTRKAQSSGRASPCRQAGENLGFPHVLNGFSHCGIHEDLRDSEGATLTITRTRAESESESGLDCCLLGVQMVVIARAAETRIIIIQGFSEGTGIKKQFTEFV